MWYVVAALVTVGVLSLFNLVFVAAVARRLRQLSAHGPAPMPIPEELKAARMLSPGTVVPEFVANTVDGKAISRGTLADETLVAFLAPGCLPCEQLLPDLTRRAQAHPGGRERVLVALTAAHPEDAVRYVSRLADVAQVIVEDDRGEFSDAFRAIAFPVVYLVGEGGRVLAAGSGATALETLPVAAGAHAG